MRRARLIVAAVLGAALVAPASALAQSTATATATATAPAVPAQTSGNNPLSPGFPQPSVSVPTTTPTVVPTIQSTTTAGTGSGFSGSAAILIAVAAIVVLGGISFFIWRDARRRAPTRTRAAAAGIDEGRRAGSKQRAKPRKLSPAERKRRKRGRAR